VIVDDFHIVGAVVVPNKTDSPLVVDADAVLSQPIARERFESIAGGIRKSSRRLEIANWVSFLSATRSMLTQRATLLPP
jgi:hypothetical protein